jgi:hypothetical protein
VRWAAIAGLLSWLILAVACEPGAAGAASTGGTPATRSLASIVIPGFGPGYSVTSQGPLNQPAFVSHSPDPAAASAALAALGETVSEGSLATVPGARVVTSLASGTRSGVDEDVTMRSGRYVALLSFFSSASTDERPITPADAARAARAQRAAMVSADAEAGTSTAGVGAHVSPASASTRKTASSSDIGWSILAVVVVALAVATPMILRYRRGGNSPPGH